MHHFFIPPSSIKSGKVKFASETSRQMSRVLRLKRGARVLALDNSGQEWEIQLETVSPQVCEGIVIDERQSKGEPKVKVTLYLGLTHREKFEWVLQKCTEVGVTAFVPVVTSRSLVQDIRMVQKKRGRWQAIIREAAEQSGRGILPQLEDPLLYPQALDVIRHHDLGFVAWEGETTVNLRSLIKKRKTRSVGVLIGPEGGLTIEEAALASQGGIPCVSLGRRILRMETAAVVASALILHALGDLG
jgi:16S rRNA (uracil1498-N3)-methyltransferase